MRSVIKGLKKLSLKDKECRNLISRWAVQIFLDLFELIFKFAEESHFKLFFIQVVLLLSHLL